MILILNSLKDFPSYRRTNKGRRQSVAVLDAPKVHMFTLVVLSLSIYCCRVADRVTFSIPLFRFFFPITSCFVDGSSSQHRVEFCMIERDCDRVMTREHDGTLLQRRRMGNRDLFSVFMLTSVPFLSSRPQWHPMRLPLPAFPAVAAFLGLINHRDEWGNTLDRCEDGLTTLTPFLLYYSLSLSLPSTYVQHFYIPLLSTYVFNK